MVITRPFSPSIFFFFNDTATTEIYTLSLHDALPISLCGKTTNLQWIYEHVPSMAKGKLLSLPTDADRTLYFDFLPVEFGTIREMKARAQIYTVPGQVFYDSTRRMVLKGADAVVFVADSQAALMDANLESLENLRGNLIANGLDPGLPMVLQ